MLSNVILVRVPWKTDQQEEDVDVARQGLIGQAVNVARRELTKLVVAVAHQGPTRQVAVVARRELTEEAVAG